ncbi:MAG: hypothetical protein KGL25_09195 [Gammaproteobacteria bacterium]|nr:hypothetical protein [Gammaproteobacteria bacterium]
MGSTELQAIVLAADATGIAGTASPWQIARVNGALLRGPNAALAGVPVPAALSAP